MNKFKALVFALTLGLSFYANANSYSDVQTAIESAGTSGYLYFIGHGADQTFTPGFDVSHIDLSFTPTYNSLTEPIGFGVYLNGDLLGSSGTWTGGDFSTHDVSFSFDPIISGGIYTLGIWVNDPVCSGCGSVQFGQGVSFTMTDDRDGASPVPLPAALPLMLSGLGVLGFAARRRKNTAV